MINTDILPTRFDIKTTPFLYFKYKPPLKIITSLKTMIKTNHSGITCCINNIMEIVIIQNLSARGSIIFPSSVISFRFLAKYPSSRSLIQITTIIISEYRYLSFKDETNRKIVINEKRNLDRLIRLEM